MDVFEDGEPIGYIDNFSQNKLELDYTKQEFIFGDYSGNFELSGEGKVITVYFPWSAITLVEEISIDDNSYIEPVKPDKKILVFGDSITQGYDALRPSNRYASKISERLNAEEYNKGIGGERFFPELSYLKEPFMPDYIIVSYGSNDWFHSDAQTFVTKCTEFYRNLTDNYPGVKTFAISPIWREDCKDERPFGEFEKVDQYVSEITAEYDNVTVVRGLDFVPHDIKYYADLRLHPNDEGFEFYAKNLYEKIKQTL